MQTQCPHCNTQFRITEEQYQIADGLVRCGVCKQTFNAFEVNQDDAQLPIEQTLDNSAEDKPEENNSADSHSELTKESPLSDNLASAGDSIDDPFANLASSSTSEESLSLFENENSSDSTNTYNAAGDINAETNTDTNPNTNLGSQHSGEPETEFDLFQTEDELLTPDSSHSIVPEEYATNHSHSVLTGVLWSIAILFLTFTLVAEYLWFNRNQLIQLPQTKPWVERLCQLTNCEIAALRDPSQIELITRNIYSHPNQKNALIVAVTLVNHANFAQPYPLMQIDFSDIRGGVIAARRFKAQTYLQTPQEQLRLLEPEATSSFTMVIQDPGKQAMTYEFNFL